MNSDETMRELSMIELEQVGGGLGWFTGPAPSGTISSQFVSTGPTANDTGTLYQTSFGSVFVSSAPDDNIQFM